MVACGCDGKGYCISAPKEWFTKAAPVIKVGLVLLKLGLTAAGIPLPIPGMAGLLQGETMSYVDGACQLFSSATGSDGVLDAVDKTVDQLLTEVEDIQRSDTAQAYECIKCLLDEKDPQKKFLGMRLVSSDGVTAWIKDSDEVEASFIAARGARRPAAPASTTTSSSSITHPAEAAATSTEGGGEGGGGGRSVRRGWFGGMFKRS